MKISPTVLIILIATALTLSMAASAQGNYTLFGRRPPAANSLSGDAFELVATVDQPDVRGLRGNSFTLKGDVGLEIGSGPGVQLGEKVYLHSVIRQ